MIRALRALLAAVLLIMLSASATSLTDVEDEVMCVACHTPLAVSESPQANAERDFIRGLIAKGESKEQIKRELVAEYGPSVLALPKAHGFNLTVYVLPPALLLVGLIGLALALPRWRHRMRASAARPKPAISPTDARRLDEDLARFDP